MPIETAELSVKAIGIIVTKSGEMIAGPVDNPPQRVCTNREKLLMIAVTTADLIRMATTIAVVADPNRLGMRAVILTGTGLLAHTVAIPRKPILIYPVVLVQMFLTYSFSCLKK